MREILIVQNCEICYISQVIHLKAYVFLLLNFNVFDFESIQIPC